MSDIDKALAAFTKSNDIGKILIFSMAVLVLVIGVIVTFMQINNTQLIDEFSSQSKSLQNISESIVKMISSQEEIGDLKKQVVNAYEKADENLDRVVGVLGLVLQGNKIPFPQDLNLALKDFRSSFKKINSTLVYLGP